MKSKKVIIYSLQGRMNISWEKCKKALNEKLKHLIQAIPSPITLRIIARENIELKNQKSKNFQVQIFIQVSNIYM